MPTAHDAALSRSIDGPRFTSSESRCVEVTYDVVSWDQLVVNGGSLARTYDRENSQLIGVRETEKVKSGKNNTTISTVLVREQSLSLDWRYAEMYSYV